MKFNKLTDDNFTVVRNDVLQDENLSWKAKGVFVYLWSQKDDWQYYSKEVVKHSTDGIKSLRSGLRELQDAGYLRITQLRENGEFTNQKWDLSPVPMPLSPDSPKGSAENGDAEKGQLTSTNSNNNLSKKTSSHKSKIYDDDSPYMILANLLLRWMVSNNDKTKQPNIQKWADEIRKMHQIDKYDLGDIKKVIVWSQRDDFWSTNILSASKLRKQFSTLYLQMTKRSGKGKTPEQPLTGDAKRAHDEAKHLAELIEQQGGLPPESEAG